MYKWMKWIEGQLQEQKTFRRYSKSAEMGNTVFFPMRRQLSRRKQYINRIESIGPNVWFVIHEYTANTFDRIYVEASHPYKYKQVASTKCITACTKITQTKETTQIPGTCVYNRLLNSLMVQSFRKKSYEANIRYGDIEISFYIIMINYMILHRSEETNPRVEKYCDSWHRTYRFANQLFR